MGFTLPEGALIPQIRGCSVCHCPIDARYSVCHSCSENQRAFGAELADIVVPLSYAVKNCDWLQQFYSDLHSYKKNFRSRSALNRMKALVLLFKTHHLRCLENTVMPVESVVSVPSSKNRLNHPLPEIADIFSTGFNGTRPIPNIGTCYLGEPRAQRLGKIEPRQFGFQQPLSGHVLILEDTWVQGHNAQSLAVQAKRSGAEKVSIVALARMLDYSFPPSRSLVDSWSRDRKFDPNICPVTGQSTASCF